MGTDPSLSSSGDRPRRSLSSSGDRPRYSPSSSGDRPRRSLSSSGDGPGNSLVPRVAGSNSQVPGAAGPAGAGPRRSGSRIADGSDQCLPDLRDHGPDHRNARGTPGDGVEDIRQTPGGAGRWHLVGGSADPRSALVLPLRGSGSEEGTTRFGGRDRHLQRDGGPGVCRSGEPPSRPTTSPNTVATARTMSRWPGPRENQAYFEQLGKDIQPIMDRYQSACIAAVSAGNAPEFYRTFVETFQASVTDGEAGPPVRCRTVVRSPRRRRSAFARGEQAPGQLGGRRCGVRGPSASATPEASPTPVPSESLPASPAPETVVPSAIG